MKLITNSLTALELKGFEFPVQMTIQNFHKSFVAIPNFYFAPLKYGIYLNTCVSCYLLRVVLVLKRTKVINKLLTATVFNCSCCDLLTNYVPTVQTTMLLIFVFYYF